MVRVVVAVPPPRILSVADAKAHLRVSGSGDDALITSYIDTAIAVLDGPDGWLGRALGLQELELLLDDFPAAGASIPLLYPRIGDVVSVTYEDSAGTDQVLSSANFKRRGEAVCLQPGRTWPSTSGQIENIRIRYRAGYDPVPAPILDAIKLMVGNLFSLSRSDGRLKKEVVEGVGSQEWDQTGAFNAAVDKTVMLLLSTYHIRVAL